MSAMEPYLVLTPYGTDEVVMTHERGDAFATVALKGQSIVVDASALRELARAASQLAERVDRGAA